MTSSSTVPAPGPGGGPTPPRGNWVLIAALAVLAVAVGVVTFVVVGTDDSEAETVEASDDDRHTRSTDAATVSDGDDPEMGGAGSVAPPVVVTRPVASTTTSTTASSASTISGSIGSADAIANRWIAIRTSAATEAEVRDVATGLEPGLTVVSTDGLPALRHPNWLAYAGPFDHPEDAVDYCLGRGVTDFNACTIVLLDPALTSVDGRPAFCSGNRVIIRPDGGWDWWDSSTNSACR